MTATLISTVADLLVKDYGLEPRNIVLGGFSQGGALAVVAGLKYRMPLVTSIAGRTRT